MEKGKISFGGSLRRKNTSEVPRSDKPDIPNVNTSPDTLRRRQKQTESGKIRTGPLKTPQSMWGLHMRIHFHSITGIMIFFSNKKT